MIIGIDQSLTATGLCILDATSRKPAKSGVIRAARGVSGVHRLDFIVEQLRRTIVEALDSSVTKLEIVREEYSYGSRGGVFELGELGGCINLELFRLALKLEERSVATSCYAVPIMSWKKYILGAGDIKKDSAYLLTVLRKTDQEFRDDNEADAFMMALFFKAMKDFSSLEVADRQLTIPHRMALVSAKVRKRLKLTDANIGKLPSPELAKAVAESMEQYRIF